MEDYPGSDDWIADGPSELAGGADTFPGLLRQLSSHSGCLRGVFLLERAIPWALPAGLAALSAPRKLFPQSFSQSGCSECHSQPNALRTPQRHQAEGNSLTRKEPEHSQLSQLVSWNAPRTKVYLGPVTNSRTQMPAQALCPEGWGKHSLLLEKPSGTKADPFSTTQHRPVPADPTWSTCKESSPRICSYFCSHCSQDSSLPSLTAQSNPRALRG